MAWYSSYARRTASCAIHAAAVACALSPSVLPPCRLSRVAATPEQAGGSFVHRTVCGVSDVGNARMGGSDRRESRRCLLKQGLPGCVCVCVPHWCADRCVAVCGCVWLGGLGVLDTCWATTELLRLVSLHSPLCVHVGVCSVYKPPVSSSDDHNYDRVVPVVGDSGVAQCYTHVKDVSSLVVPRDNHPACASPSPTQPPTHHGSSGAAVSTPQVSEVSFGAPTRAEGKALYALARRTTLDQNSPYAYMMFADHFAATCTGASNPWCTGSIAYCHPEVVVAGCGSGCGCVAVRLCAAVFTTSCAHQSPAHPTSPAAPSSASSWATASPTTHAWLSFGRSA